MYFTSPTPWLNCVFAQCRGGFSSRSSRRRYVILGLVDPLRSSAPLSLGGAMRLSLGIFGHIVSFFTGGRSRRCCPSCCPLFVHQLLRFMPSSETIRAHRRDVRASNLLFGSLALTVALALVRHLVLHLDVRSPGPVFAGMLAVTALLYSGLFYAIRRGHYWAKVMLLLLFGAAGVGSLITYKTTLAHLQLDPLNVISNVVHYSARVWALVLLFHKPRVPAAA